MLRAYRVGGRAIRIRLSDLRAVVRPVRPRRRTHAEPDTVELGEPAEDVDEFIAELEREHARQLAERGGKPFDSSVRLIREAREERTAQL